MAAEPLERVTETDHVAVYDRSSVESFFHAASESRTRLLEEIAVAKTRIAVAEAAAAPDTNSASARTVVEGQRLLRDEVRANRRAVAAITDWAEAEVARILASARALAAYEQSRNCGEEPVATAGPRSTGAQNRSNGAPPRPLDIAGRP